MKNRFRVYPAMDIPSCPPVSFNSGQEVKQSRTLTSLGSHFRGDSRRPRGRAIEKQNPWNKNSILFSARQPSGALFIVIHHISAITILIPTATSRLSEYSSHREHDIHPLAHGACPLFDCRTERPPRLAVLRITASFSD